ncbi:MAG: DsrE family protein [Spirochaetes bacterium]|nr:MAG: DsrE family protein [Spirochaetota bacterium]
MNKSDKVVIIISTAEKEKVYAGMMYAVNALKQGWMNDVKLIFFGPSEKLLLSDSELQEYLNEYLELKGEVTACKFISDNDQTSEKIGKMGIQVEYVGEMISNFIKDGFVPMIW